MNLAIRDSAKDTEMVLRVFIADVFTTNMVTIDCDADSNVLFELHTTAEDTLYFYKNYAETYDQVKSTQHTSLSFEIELPCNIDSRQERFSTP